MTTLSPPPLTARQQVGTLSASFSFSISFSFSVSAA